jgi:hypothetical protein
MTLRPREAGEKARPGEAGAVTRGRGRSLVDAVTTRKRRMHLAKTEASRRMTGTAKEKEKEKDEIEIEEEGEAEIRAARAAS